MTWLKRIWMDGDTMRVDEISGEDFYRRPKEAKMIVDDPTADRIQSLIADNERLREALARISGGYGHCSTCRNPCDRYIDCEPSCSRPNWALDDAQETAAAALSHKDMSRG